MSNIFDIIRRAESLRDEKAINSISPERVGGIMADTLKYLNDFQLASGSLGLDKTYVSVSDMNSDTEPVSDITGRPLKSGQLAVIVPTSESDPDAGKVYRFNSPGDWTYIKTIGNITADKELSETSENPIQNSTVTRLVTEYNVSNHFPTGGIDGTNRYTLGTAIAKIPASLRTVGIKCSFLNEAGQVETWEYHGGSYLSVSSWIRSDISAVNEKIDSQKAEVDAAKNEAMSAIDNREQEVIDNFNAQRVTPEMLSEATKQLINSSGGGTINNLPDDEDITSTGGDTPVLKFKDRKPDHGKGYVILRRNKTFAEQVTQANTIYEIRYDFDLDAEFTMPQDCILKFVGGHIRGAKLNLTNTFIDASCIMGILPSQIGGVMSNNVAYPEWLADNSTDDYAPLVQSLIDSASDGGLIIKFTANEYQIHPVITLRSNISLESVSASKLIISTDELYSAVVFSNKKLDNVHH